MTIEAIITRALEVRFIDARTLATEAKLNLNITGYPSKEQEQQILREAISLFVSKSLESQREMKKQAEILETATKAFYDSDHSINKKKGDDHSSASTSVTVPSTVRIDSMSPEEMKMVQAQCCVIL
eukprot:CAMPEP_0119551006 /NCGR_PEP_ID=MMETSP1352-20130426/4410_1 /TAXON_ID=265584 /ORGANISM="Stauroneis constricta, Strain CCMP1120" /LENGTH=125 /DNA_ID=CAMNT_0007597011 /DNA_START=96 /DNA_END=473 /DNA_ORIENTATION=+